MKVKITFTNKFDRQDSLILDKEMLGKIIGQELVSIDAAKMESKDK